MASQGKDVGPSLPSRCASQMGPWEAILEAVREQLPSLDSDSSLSDYGEEELFIYQRNQTTLIPDLSEELADDPDGDGVTVANRSPEVCRMQAPETKDAGIPLAEQDVGGFSAELGAKWNARRKEGQDPDQPLGSSGDSSSLLRKPEETHTWQEGDLGGMSFNSKGSPSPPSGTQGEATLCLPEGDLRMDPNAASWFRKGSDSANRRALRRERRKMIERDLLHKVTCGARNPTCSDHSQVEETPYEAAAAGPGPGTPPQGSREGLPVLSLQQLEELDLDHILQSLAGEEDNRGDHTRAVVWPAGDHLPGPGHDEPSAQDRLMERLTLLCATQSRASSPARKVPADMLQDTEHLETRSRCASAELGFQAELSQHWLRRPVEPPTTFIDLRPVEPSDRGPLKSPSPSPSSSSSSSSSSSDSEEAGEEATAALRDQWGPAELRNCTGKSQLLQQLRAFQKRTAQPRLPASKGPCSTNAQLPEDTAASGTGRKKHLTLWAERQSAPASLSGKSPGAPEEPLGPAAARDVLVSPLGQL